MTFSQSPYLPSVTNMYISLERAQHTRGTDVGWTGKGNKKYVAAFSTYIKVFYLINGKGQPTSPTCSPEPVVIKEFRSTEKALEKGQRRFNLEEVWL
jgi:hypothetical protein